MTIPDRILQVARARSDARRAKDWPTADRLRAEIEAAGWRVVDRGIDFRLEAAHPPDIEAAGLTRYGRSESVPGRLEAPPSSAATVVVPISAGAGSGVLEGLERLLTGAFQLALPGVDAVIVADGLDDAGVTEALAIAERVGSDGRAVEVIATSARLGHAAALNIGLRRSRGEVVIVLDPSVEPTGDVIGPLVAALEDPAVAVVGPFGLASIDLRRFEEVVAAQAPLEVAAIQGYLMAFRRADAIARGPFDERFRYYRNLDIWWSLVLRDEGQGRPPRRAVAVPDLPLRRGVPRAWAETRESERERLSKRNFYRVLDRFRDRPDLAVAPPPG